MIPEWNNSLQGEINISANLLVIRHPKRRWAKLSESKILGVKWGARVFLDSTVQKGEGELDNQILILSLQTFIKVN